VAVLLAVGEVWGMRSVAGRVLRTVEELRSAAVGNLASLLQRLFSMVQLLVCRGRPLPAHLFAESSSTDRQYTDIMLCDYHFY